MLKVEAYQGIEKALRDFVSDNFQDSEGSFFKGYPITYQEIESLLEHIDKARQTGEEPDNEGTLQVVTHRLPGSIIKELDRITVDRGCHSRSKLIRDLVTAGLEEPDGEDEPENPEKRLLGNMGEFGPVLASAILSPRLRAIEAALKKSAEADLVLAIIESERYIDAHIADLNVESFIERLDRLKELYANLIEPEKSGEVEAGQ